ncbi:Dehydrogenase/reductase SDR family member 2 [Fusarium oxysporum f. sp. cubense race 1]|uniref:Dehydrogenase/reductase SDR family member 2 n=1 Tax=Fusarium oxysporum f. sp. cubense (strain race 1) TaxID=1229664 RepID=N4V3Q0_FUSC1|nr:Dehydrogenase/reductase SDR family member 2 [Fusarium oxysporum f. sp. cubense race 1]
MSLPGLKTLHKKPYPVIYPTRPELSQEGRTILITGGNSGIGFSIARSFVISKAKRVIVASRRHDSIQTAVSKLAKQAKDSDSPTAAEGRVCDVGDLNSTASRWQGLKDDGIHVDTLVLSAASLGKNKPLLEAGRDGVWDDFETNTRATIDFTMRFYGQEAQATETRKALISLSTCVTYMRHYATDRPSYGITKLAGTDYLQQIALEVSPKKMQISIFHPGIIFNELAAARGMDDTTYPWDDENLPGNFAVWAASPEAEFIHGRFVWAAWDVEELKTRIEDGVKKNPRFLMAGIEGLSASIDGI